MAHQAYRSSQSDGRPAYSEFATPKQKSPTILLYYHRILPGRRQLLLPMLQAITSTIVIATTDLGSSKFYHKPSQHQLGNLFANELLSPTML